MTGTPISPCIEGPFLAYAPSQSSSDVRIYRGSVAIQAYQLPLDISTSDIKMCSGSSPTYG